MVRAPEMDGGTRRCWPLEIIAVRHGESRASVASAEAHAAGREESGLTGSEADLDFSVTRERVDQVLL